MATTTGWYKQRRGPSFPCSITPKWSTSTEGEEWTLTLWHDSQAFRYTPREHLTLSRVEVQKLAKELAGLLERH